MFKFASILDKFSMEQNPWKSNADNLQNIDHSRVAEFEAKVNSIKQSVQIQGALDKSLNKPMRIENLEFPNISKELKVTKLSNSSTEINSLIKLLEK